MRDPVTGFDYPPDWVKKSKSPELLPLAEKGFAVLTASGTILMRGYTTGTTPAAACKAAMKELHTLDVTPCTQCHSCVEVCAKRAIVAIPLSADPIHFEMSEVL